MLNWDLVIQGVLISILTLLIGAFIKFLLVVNNAIKSLQKDTKIINEEIKTLKNVVNTQDIKITITEKDVLALQINFKHIIELLTEIKNNTKK
jgi:hypothetical protein